MDIMKEVAVLEPFGTGNPAPVFKFEDLYVLKADVVGGKHISVLFAPTKESYSSRPIKSIAFNAVGTKLEDVLMSQYPYKLSVFGNLKVNIWQSSETIQLHIKDILVHKNR